MSTDLQIKEGRLSFLHVKDAIYKSNIGKYWKWLPSTCKTTFLFFSVVTPFIACMDPGIFPPKVKTLICTIGAIAGAYLSTAVVLRYLNSRNVDGKETETFLKHAFQDKFEIGEKLISFSNKNCVVMDATRDKWVLRTPNEISNLLSNRSQEKAMIEWAYQQKISLIEVKACDPSKGYLLTRFLSGRSLSKVDFQNSTLMSQALALLHRLHTSTSVPVSTQFNPLERFMMTKSVMEKKRLTLPKEVDRINSQLRGFLTQLPPSCFHSVPCHNDPTPENFFLEDESLYLHDWEFSCLNDPMWDLTYMSVIGEIESRMILDAYPGTDPFAMEKMAFFRPFILFSTVVWASSERLQPSSSIDPATTSWLYENFMSKTTDFIDSDPFKSAFQKLLREKI